MNYRSEVLGMGQEDTSVLNTLFTHLDSWCRKSCDLTPSNGVESLWHRIEHFWMKETGPRDFVIFEMLPAF